MPGTKRFIYRKDLFLYTLFAIAMAYLEATVVVYLRELFYPLGFVFPLQDIPPKIYLVELGREAATIIMLWTVSGITNRHRTEWFAFFSFNFAVWDIWYYIWLKIMLDWPATLLDWDVLFLIPLPWIGPVLAPLLVSAALIFAALMILHFESRGKPLKLTPVDWGLEVLAGLIIVGSFLAQTGKIAAKLAPESYPWWVFIIGMVLGLTVFVHRVYKDPDTDPIKSGQ